ncbi:Hsp70 family protein [Kribbella monticola]|uniref:Hsp70 family protein n=1 Tax=Kribbella monticola TaxID=2185285 RepID=UPI000DD32B2D|nr:Hsp70 family protein [Kribbella monticola]
MAAVGRIVGIDLGTTFSAIATVMPTGKPVLLSNREGERLTPSVVLFDDARSVLVGSMAKRSAVTAPLDVVQFVKRQMGNPDWKFETSTGEQYGPEAISAMILTRLKEDAELVLGAGQVTDAVITVPAFFDDARRRATRDAGTIAGLNVLRVLNEPTAAALAYGFVNPGEATVLVFDLGGGTFDVTVLRIAGGDFDVIGTDGLHELGGFEWDNRLMEWLNDQFRQAGGRDLSQTFESEADLRDKAEMAKHVLSQATTARVVLSGGGVTKSIIITREVFEEITADLLNQSRDLTISLVEEMGLAFSDIDNVLLVGGSTRMPMVPRMVADISGRQPLRVDNPDELVALGAAIQANLLSPDGPILDGPAPRISDVTSQGLGVIALNDQRIPRNTVVVARNSKIPSQGAEIFGTADDGQTAIRVHVTQGDDEDPGYVRLVTKGRYPDGGQPLEIPPYDAGAPIQVVLHYDIDQTIQVEVIDLTAGASLGTFELDNVANLTDEELAEAIRKNKELGVG